MKQVKPLLILLLAFTLLLSACGGGDGEPVAGNGGDAGGEIDPDTGLPINPDDIRSGPFIVEGVLDSLNLTPQTAPEFVIRAPSGKTYRIRSQPLAETFYDDGEPIVPSQIRQGMPVRATAEYDPDLTLLRSDDLTFIRQE